MVLYTIKYFGIKELIVAFKMFCIFSTDLRGPIPSTQQNHSIPASSPFHHLHMAHHSQVWDPMGHIQMVRTHIWPRDNTRQHGQVWMARAITTTRPVLHKILFRWDSYYIVHDLVIYINVCHYYEDINGIKKKHTINVTGISISVNEKTHLSCSLSPISQNRINRFSVWN
jgi:hypothetical protein